MDIHLPVPQMRLGIHIRDRQTSLRARGIDLRQQGLSGNILMIGICPLFELSTEAEEPCRRPELIDSYHHITFPCTAQTPPWAGH